jgi:predicted homoserine dehydrogenase-like protein
VQLVAIADLAPAAAQANLARVGWAPERSAARSIDEAAREGARTSATTGARWSRTRRSTVVVECTGHPIAAVEHCLAAFEAGKHVVNVTVEADAFCGPLLARRAAQAGVVYSLAFGDQPALICDLVDWARTCGFPVVAAGRGHKWLPHFSQSTPETVWGHYGLTPEQAKRGGLNPKMFNSFLDGSKPSSSAPRCRTRPASACRATASCTRRPASPTSPSSRGRARRAGSWSARAWSR